MTMAAADKTTVVKVFITQERGVLPEMSSDPWWEQRQITVHLSGQIFIGCRDWDLFRKEAKLQNELLKLVDKS